MGAQLARAVEESCGPCWIRIVYEIVDTDGPQSRQTNISLFISATPTSNGSGLGLCRMLIFARYFEVQSLGVGSSLRQNRQEGVHPIDIRSNGRYPPETVDVVGNRKALDAVFYGHDVVEELYSIFWPNVSK